MGGRVLPALIAGTGGRRGSILTGERWHWFRCSIGNSSLELRQKMTGGLVRKREDS